MTRWLRDWGPALAWAVLIFLVSARSSVPVRLDRGLDKLAHFGTFLVLGIALGWGGVRRGFGRAALVALGLAYAASDELHQALVPGRAPDLLDWLADAAGVLLGVLIAYPFFTKLQALRS